MTMTVEGPTSQGWISTKDKHPHTEKTKLPHRALPTEDPHQMSMMGAEALPLLGKGQASDFPLQASFGVPEALRLPEGDLLKTKGALLRTSQATGVQRHSLVGQEVLAQQGIFQRAVQEVHQGITLTTIPVTLDQLDIQDLCYQLLLRALFNYQAAWEDTAQSPTGTITGGGTPQTPGGEAETTRNPERGPAGLKVATVTGYQRRGNEISQRTAGESGRERDPILADRGTGAKLASPGAGSENGNGGESGRQTGAERGTVAGREDGKENGIRNQKEMPTRGESGTKRERESVKESETEAERESLNAGITIETGPKTENGSVKETEIETGSATGSETGAESGHGAERGIEERTATEEESANENVIGTERETGKKTETGEREAKAKSAEMTRKKSDLRLQRTLKDLLSPRLFLIKAHPDCLVFLYTGSLFGLSH